MLSTLCKAVRTGIHGNSCKVLALTIASCPIGVYAAQEQTPSNKVEDIEKISVVGTQIRGGQMAESLAVSVLSSDDIAEFGIDSGDELLDLIPENGQNFFSEAENTGGVNAARGDIGGVNLRNVGTGNTLVLLNGRRMVNAASYQTEEVGGSFVPVNTVNSNMIPVAGLKRVEVLRDGASAIYGADAVAGVVNNVVQTDFEGFDISFKFKDFENLPRNDETLTLKLGQTFNEGRTNLSAFYNYYHRDRVSSLDDERWSSSDFRDRLPEGSPWAETTDFRNDSAHNIDEAQFDMSGQVAGFTDSRGEFEIFPKSSEKCSFPGSYSVSDSHCALPDGTGMERYDFNAVGRDIASDLTRHNLFVFVNHAFDSGLESFSELMLYKSETNLVRGATYPRFADLYVGASNYYNPFGPIGSVNRLDSLSDDDKPNGARLEIDNYRFAERLRSVDNDGDSYRVLQGFRGDLGAWYWESAVSHSKAEKSDITHNRVSNTLIQEALNDSTEAAYNPFSGGENSNIERALISVQRLSETKLTTFDVKASNSDLFELPGGYAALLVGAEYRKESYKDDRDDRLDGTIVFIPEGESEDDVSIILPDGSRFFTISDVVNSSPTPDSNGSRNVTSLFAEFQLPVLDNLDIQAAIRYENFSDVGDTTVGKLAFGYRPFESLLVRGSYSTAFRAPNLVTVNEEVVARSQSRQDALCEYAVANAVGFDTSDVECDYTVQRIAQGSDKLKPEESENTSVGFVWTPTQSLTLTLDYWSIDKENTIGLIGEENHMIIDLLDRLESGSCQGNANVVRDEATDEETALFESAGLCPAGRVAYVDDQYANLDRRVIKGHDIGVYYDLDTSIGNFNFKVNASILDKYDQKAEGVIKEIFDAKEQGVLPEGTEVSGFADLIGKDGNQEKRYTAKIRWRNGNWGASVSTNYIGDFYQSGLTLEDGTRYEVPSMQTYDATVDYRFQFNDWRSRARFGVKNLTDERAPLTDNTFGFYGDAHSDYGRYFYLDMSLSF